jgi:ParG
MAKSAIGKRVSGKKDKGHDQPRIKRMNLNVDVSLHDAFKAATAAQGKKMTDVLVEYIRQYVQEHGVKQSAASVKTEKEPGHRS